MIRTNNQSTSSEYAADCLAWHVDAPTASDFLVGSTQIDAISSAATANGVNLHRAEDIATIPGQGITARIGGRFIAIGPAPLFATLDIPFSTAIQQSVAKTRLAGHETILIGTWKGVEHVCAIVNPKTGIRVA